MAATATAKLVVELDELDQTLRLPWTWDTTTTPTAYYKGRQTQASADTAETWYCETRELWAEGLAPISSRLEAEAKRDEARTNVALATYGERVALATLRDVTGGTEIP